MLCRYCVSLGTYCFTPTPIPYPLFCRELLELELIVLM
nr:MAG TPA: protein of unknown function DUF4150 [Caudoviricetes sp.]